MAEVGSERIPLRDRKSSRLKKYTTGYATLILRVVRNAGSRTIKRADSRMDQQLQPEPKHSVRVLSLQRLRKLLVY
jgi:hypothetical protein